jgi:hypothetical protein
MGRRKFPRDAPSAIPIVPADAAGGESSKVSGCRCSAAITQEGQTQSSCHFRGESQYGVSMVFRRGFEEFRRYGEQSVSAIDLFVGTKADKGGAAWT